MPKNVVVKSHAQLLEYLHNDLINVVGILPINDDLAYVNFCDITEAAKPAKFTNIPISAFVTAYGRLKLLSYLTPGDRRILYHDTDSIIFVKRPNDDFDPPTGNFFGRHVKRVIGVL